MPKVNQSFFYHSSTYIVGFEKTFLTIFQGHYCFEKAVFQSILRALKSGH